MWGTVGSEDDLEEVKEARKGPLAPNPGMMWVLVSPLWASHTVALLGISFKQFQFYECYLLVCCV